MVLAPTRSGLPVGLTSINLTTALRNRYDHFPCLPRSQEELRAVAGPAQPQNRRCHSDPGLTAGLGFRCRGPHPLSQDIHPSKSKVSFWPRTEVKMSSVTLSRSLW